MFVKKLDFKLLFVKTNFMPGIKTLIDKKFINKIFAMIVQLQKLCATKISLVVPDPSDVFANLLVRALTVKGLGTYAWPACASCNYSYSTNQIAAFSKLAFLQVTFTKKCLNTVLQSIFSFRNCLQRNKKTPKLVF